LTDFVKIENGFGPEGRIAVVRFDRGDGINALSPEALRQLTDAARSFEDDGATSVVVLAGNAKAFSAGFDLKDAEGKRPANSAPRLFTYDLRSQIRFRHAGMPGARDRQGPAPSAAGKF